MKKKNVTLKQQRKEYVNSLQELGIATMIDGVNVYADDYTIEEAGLYWRCDTKAQAQAFRQYIDNNKYMSL